VWIEALIIFVCVAVSFVGVALPKGSSSASDLLIELTSILAVVALMALLGAAAHFLFTYANCVISVTGAAMAILSGYGASTTYHYVVERRQRAMIKTMFSTYLNPSLVDELVTHPERLVLGGRREELTVLFSDIEGFTTISQSLPPEQLVALLNEYLDEMSEVIFDNDGTVDKYEGDAIMAFWGAPLPQKDHALRACTAAIQMIQRLEKLNLRWTKEEKPFLNIRIGINTGPMVVGNMGSQRKFAYTVIGDSVNVASRLEGANREYRTRIMVTERTFRLLNDRIVGRVLDRITVRGRSEAVTVYELLYLRSEPVHQAIVEMLQRYTEGMALYQTQRWSQAREKFEQALAALPDDYPSRIYMSRAAMYEKNPPPEWTGIFRPQ
jgi:adenylate cyclase